MISVYLLLDSACAALPRTGSSFSPSFKIVCSVRKIKRSPHEKNIMIKLCRQSRMRKGKSGCRILKESFWPSENGEFFAFLH